MVDLCPVGALCSKDFLYKQRVWWLKTADSVCPNCSTGCSIYVDECEDRVYRLRPRGKSAGSGHFMCDEGRFGWKYMHSEQRLTLPEQRRDGKIVSRDWDVVLPDARRALGEAAKVSGKKIAAVLSPWMTVEEAYLLASYLKSLSANVSLAMGPVRVVGEDDKYPKDVKGRSVEPVKFTIRAEKCPNRRGVEAVLRHFAGDVQPMGDVLGRAAAGDFVGHVFGWRRSGRLDHRFASGGAGESRDGDRAGYFAVASEPARDVRACGGSFAERDGTFVNHAGLAQEIHRSIRSPGEAKPDGRILWDLAGRHGLFNLRCAATKKLAKRFRN